MRYAVLLIGICGVASAALMARFGLAAGVSAEALSAWRLVLASTALILLAMIRRATPVQRADLWRVCLAGIFLAVHFATWIASLDYVSIARSTLMVSTSPLWAGLLGLVVPSLKPKREFWLGLGIAALGTVLVTTQGVSEAAPKGPPWIGDLLAIIGAICIVPYLLLSQAVQSRSSTQSTITWIYSSSAATLFAYLVITGQAAPPRSPTAWISIAGMAVFAQLLGHTSLNFSLRSFTAAQVATATLLEPVFAAILAAAFMGEYISAMQAVGGLVLLAGVAIGLRSRSDEPQPAVAGDSKRTLVQ